MEVINVNVNALAYCLLNNFPNNEQYKLFEEDMKSFKFEWQINLLRLFTTQLALITEN